MTNKTSQMSEALIQVADKLGYGVQELYQIFLKAQQIEGLLSLLGVIVWVTSTYTVTKKVVDSEDYQDKVDAQFAYAAVGMVAALILGLAVIVLHGASMQILAPEYTAAEKLITSIGGAAK